MSDYKAPVQDMNFVLNHHIDLNDMAKLPGYEDLSSELTESILEEANKLAGDVFSPLNVLGDRTGVKIVSDVNVETPKGFKEAYQQYSDGGWGSLQFDTEYGGQGLPFALAIPVQEMWHSANMSWGLCPLLTQGAIEAIEANASDDLKSKYLPKMIEGKWTGTMNLTESQSGSDMATLRSRAEPDGDHYRVFGQKIFITWGEHDMTENIIHLVLARLPDAPEGVKGLSLFLVPKVLVNDDCSLGDRNDCRVFSLEEKIGIHASPTCVMSYGENEGAIGYLVGQEHKGLRCMFSMMNNARLTVGLQGVSISERAYQLARNYALDRPQGIAPGETSIGPIIKHPDVRRMLMTMRCLTEAGRALAYVACSSVDYRNKVTGNENLRTQHDLRAALLTPIVKGWCTEIAQEVTSIGIQVHGGMGFIEETGAAQHYRDARILPIYEGTNGIQSIDLAERKTRGDNGGAVDNLIEEMRQAIEQSKSCDQSISSMGEKLSKGVDAFNNVKQILLDNADEDINLSGSISFNYLLLAGTVCGGWQMLIAAMAASKIESTDPFYANKIKLAQFYTSNILPRYLSYAAIINAGSETTMALDESQY